ncbi:MAG: ATP synthase F1 subunit delta [Chitinophagaceae bacterium]|jgi:F-type H+-transporting ATPase subunit delta|nr:ATP synthase F1 subunit delta [Chitinophagaceae bacterium]
MPNPRLAARYAKSLIDLSIEKGQLEQVYQDMQWLQAACKGSRDFLNLLRSPVIKSDTKRKVLEAATAGKLSELTAGFIRLLVTKGRESNLPEITAAAINFYKQHKNIYTVQLTTATPVDSAVRAAIIEQVKKSAGVQHIELEEKVNPDIIGGFVLQLGDKLVDASIAYDLRAIAKQFDNNDFIYKIR